VHELTPCPRVRPAPARALFRAEHQLRHLPVFALGEPQVATDGTPQAVPVVVRCRPTSFAQRLRRGVAQHLAPLPSLAVSHREDRTAERVLGSAELVVQE
jgi:hypothetical protein